MIDKNTIPKHWEIKKMGDVCKLKNGFAFKSTDYHKIGVPVIRISDINNGIVSSENAVRINPESEYENYTVELDDILVAMSGATTGKFGVYRDKEKAYQNQRVGKFKILDNRILDNQFLFYHLNSLKRQIEKDAYGGAQPNISSSKIEEMDIAIPPFSEQQQIVSKIDELFSELDKGKQQLEIVKQQLKTYRQAVLKCAFEGRFTSVNIPASGTSRDLSRSNNNLKSLPEGWKWVKIKDFAETFGGYAFKSTEFREKGKYQVIRMGNIRPGIFRFSESPVFLDDLDKDILNRALIKVNDVIITQTGTRKKRDYGFTALVSRSNLLLNQRLTAIRCTTNYLPKFLLYFTWTDFFKNQFFANETGNVGQGNVGMKAITDTLIPFCDLEEQHQIINEIETRLSVCDKMEETIENSLRQLESLRQSILKQAFEGKLV
jgi:type I restriction enzyme, S subunit